MQKVLTVQELNQNLKNYLENIDYFKLIYVKGEISNLTLNKSGHVYFSIKDENATISCMIWKNNAHKLTQLNPKEGMQITCAGRITYYVVGGKVNFEVRDVQIEGIGELQKIYEERFVKLKQAGWFDQSIKKRLPNIVQNVGIITADSGAAIHDLVTTIHRRMPSTNIFLFPAQVQGNQSAHDVAEKIKQANSFATKLDVLIVGRGGGSYEDLWSFNEMELLQAIKDSDIPIVSAVGHEPDVTLADYVADVRAATPTAAGELVSRDIQELKKQLKYHLDKLRLQIENRYELESKDLLHLKSQQNKAVEFAISSKEILIEQLEYSIPESIKTKINNSYKDVSKIKELLLQNIQIAFNNQNIKIIESTNVLKNKSVYKLEQYKNNFNFMTSNFKSLISQKMKIEELRFESMANKLNLLNPKKPLENGYGIVTNENGIKITSYKDVKTNEKIKVFLIDGKLVANLEEVIANE
ncbi:exodeoxyribonuclease VII large subunit [Mycoplasma yeatsii]|uniref:exodeoxyribonuclease VII large subunit n=1 Tax=Mycoplasma yeatsii TaxID=51365 RepID=UPI0005B24A86|nr:exodeoxyribonuclease VII large subunit [Mycoplasma yeatsii]AJM71736.1 exodeoxyribonuclease VII large subunit [Mycoplasma yeatsii GM274B]